MCGGRGGGGFKKREGNGISVDCHRPAHNHVQQTKKTNKSTISINRSRTASSPSPITMSGRPSPFTEGDRVASARERVEAPTCVYIKSYGFLMYGGYVLGREGLVGISLSMCIIDLCHTPSMCNVQITTQNQRGKNGPWTRSPRSACRAGGAAAWQSRRRRHRPPHIPGLRLLGASC